MYGDVIYLEVKPKNGDGVYSLFDRYDLPYNEKYKSKFYELNEGKFTRNKGLLRFKKYRLPIRLIQFNGITIRSTIDYDNYPNAKKIQDYNDKLHDKGIKPEDFRESNILWLPVYMLPEDVYEKIPESAEPDISDLADNLATEEPRGNVFPIFGPEYAKVEIIDQKLDGRVFYLVAGHGGPDPGAIGIKGRHELCEDEYAYDVTLRLARVLLQRGAKVYLIVRDPDDGIRDGKYLECDRDEIYFDEDTIDADQLIRLQKRADIINKYYIKNKRTAKSQHVIVIHVDSRSVRKRIDIFFYHHEHSRSGLALAEQLEKTIKEKYGIAQPGRGYSGSVSYRDLFMLRKTYPPTVYIELGNIRNPLDQVRFIEKNNRQAIANWLGDGLIELFE